MAKNTYTQSGYVIVFSQEEMNQKIKALKRLRKPLFIALLKNPKEFNQELS